MRSIAVLICCLILSSCASVEIVNKPVESLLPGHKTLQDLAKILPGMSREDVLTLLGPSLIIGYEQKSDKSYAPIVVSNPYREEKIEHAGKKYDVFYILSAISKPDGLVSDDELIPLIFQNNKLTSKGWDPLFAIKGR